MIRTLCLLLLGTLSFSCFAQVRFEKLVIRPREVYTLTPSDIIVSDTLIMMDSSCIRLNNLKTENYIRAQVVIIGKHCRIDGRGTNGKKGTNGVTSLAPSGPCQNGAPGRNGGRGLDGTAGLNLFLYIDQLDAIGSLIIDLSGGNGGDGGNGGTGAGGTPGTKYCSGGNGGNGGSGGGGGNGGHGGTLMLGGKDAASIKALIGNAVAVYSKGGTFGYGGLAGYGGGAGLGPVRNNGRSGTPGVSGTNGKPSTNGTVLFENQ